MEGFVFLSGYVFALVYLRKAHQPALLIAKSWRRAAQVYLYHVLIIFTLLLLAPFFYQFGGFWVALLDYTNQQSWPDLTLQILTFGLLPKFCGILPLYTILIIFAPFFILAIARLGIIPVFAASSSLWLLGQYYNPLVPVQHLFTDEPPYPWNVLSWQIIFVAGLLFGKCVFNNEIPRTFTRKDFAVLIAGAAIILFLLRHGLIGPGYSHFSSYVARQDLAWLRTLNFFVLAAAIALILRFVDRRHHLPWLSLLGRHSLQVFAFHVIIVWLAKPLNDYLPSQYSKTTYLVFLSCCIFALWIPAVAHEGYVRARMKASRTAERPSPERS
jgi:hypothetical protein